MSDLLLALEVSDDNPYSTGEILELEQVGKEAQTYFLERKPLVYIQSPLDRRYVVAEGDTLWGISYQAYGNSKYYWVIQDVNNILFAPDIELSDVLIVPNLEDLFEKQPEED